MKKIIVSVTSDLSTDNRVDRTCKALLEYGFEVLLVGRIKSDSIDLENREYPCKRFKLFFQKGAFFYMEYNLLKVYQDHLSIKHLFFLKRKILKKRKFFSIKKKAPF